MKKNSKKFATRFWMLKYEDAHGQLKSRMAQGPKHYRVSKVKKDLKLVHPEIKIISIKRIPRPEWSVIFEERDCA